MSIFEELNTTWRNIITTIPIVDNMNEFLIVKYLVLHQTEIEPMKNYPLIYAWEFPFNPQETHKGKSDLILTDGQSKFLIVEVKYLSDESGSTARVKRNKNRKQGKKQAEKYKQRFRNLHSDYEVQSMSFTNEMIDSEIYEKFLHAEWGKIEEIFQLDVPSYYSPKFNLELANAHKLLE